VSWLIVKGQELSTSAKLHGSVQLCGFFWPRDDRRAHLAFLAADVDLAPQRQLDQVWKVTKVVVNDANNYSMSTVSLNWKSTFVMFQRASSKQCVTRPDVHFSN
jgi:hypothetical protein